MRTARSLAELGPGERAVAIGMFDGVHLGHRRVIQAAVDSGLTATVVTCDPHPRVTLGAEVELLTSTTRRLDLIEELGATETLLLPFTSELARASPEEFASRVLRPLGAQVIVAGSNFRFGRGRSGDLGSLRAMGFEIRPVPLVAEVSSSIIRQLLRAGEVASAARLLGRPPELDGMVVSGWARGGTLGFPTANLRVDPDLLVPAHGIYAGAVGERRAAVSIGTNPHYGGEERTIEAFLLDFEGDLYGRRLVLELWQRLRDERAFGSEQDLVEQIALDVEQARLAERPVSVR